MLIVSKYYRLVVPKTYTLVVNIACFLQTFKALFRAIEVHSCICRLTHINVAIAQKLY